MSTAALESAVLEDVSEGKLTDRLLALYRNYVQAVGQSRLVPSAVTREFWDKVMADDVYRDAILGELPPQYDPAILATLQSLLAAGEVGKDCRHLALAFAVVYGRAGSAPVGGPDAPRAGRPAPPTMIDSFQFYVQHQDAMKYPLLRTPWQVLAFVTDNDASIPERLWALQRYSHPISFEGIYHGPPYIPETQGQGMPMLRTLPYTLPFLGDFGGGGEDLAFYASRVLKTFGVPAMCDRGEISRGAWTWTAWLVDHPRSGPQLRYASKLDADRLTRGQVFSPLSRTQVPDSRVLLLAAGVRHSYSGYLDARLACDIYDAYKARLPNQAAAILKDARQRNPYCAGVWLRLAQATAEGTISQAEGQSLITGMLKDFATYPDLTFDVLQAILQPRLKVGLSTTTQQAAETLAILDRACGLYDQEDRADLAVKLRLLQGQYLEALNKADVAARLYAAASEQYAANEATALNLMDQALRLMADRYARVQYLGELGRIVPEYRGSYNRRHKIRNEAFLRVTSRLIEELTAAGQTQEAQKWRDRLK